MRFCTQRIVPKSQPDSVRAEPQHNTNYQLAWSFGERQVWLVVSYGAYLLYLQPAIHSSDLIQTDTALWPLNRKTAAAATNQFAIKSIVQYGSGNTDPRWNTHWMSHEARSPRTPTYHRSAMTTKTTRITTDIPWMQVNYHMQSVLII